MRAIHRLVWLTVFGFVVSLLLSSAATAQVPQYGAVSPLQNIASRPTVSPYLNLLQPRTTGVPNYQTLVRPQLDQRRAEQMNAAAIQRLQSQVNRPGNYSRTTGESVQVRGTGHVSGFQNHMHFFPGPNQAAYQAAWQSKRAQ